MPRPLWGAASVFVFLVAGGLGMLLSSNNDAFSRTPEFEMGLRSLAGGVQLKTS